MPVVYRSTLQPTMCLLNEVGVLVTSRMGEQLSDTETSVAVSPALHLVAGQPLCRQRGFALFRHHADTEGNGVAIVLLLAVGGPTAPNANAKTLTRWCARKPIITRR